MLNYKKEILYPLLAASLFIIIVMLWLFITMVNVNEIAKSKDFIDQQRFNIITLRNAVLDAESSQRGYLITNNVTFLDHYNDSKILTNKTIVDMAESTHAFPKLAPMLKNVQQLCEEKFSIIEATITVQLNAGSYASHLTLTKDKGKMVMDAIRLELRLADEYLLERRQTLVHKMETSITYTILASIALVLIIFAILLFSYFHTLKLFKEISTSSRTVSDLSYQATHDPLTNLLNRRGFENILGNVHEIAAIEKRKYAIFYMDLDGFKAINDQYAHETGDQLLINVSRLFQSFLRELDCLARLGGDEFTLIVKNFKDQEELEGLANRLINALNPPILIDGKTLKIGVSIGIAIYRVNGFKPEELMQAADAAMYQAKKLGKNRVSFLS